MINFNVTMTETENLNVYFECIQQVEGHSEEYDYYTGEYNVIPQANDEVVLYTADKVLTDNVTVQKVPFYRVGNEYGNTVYIASEVE